MSHAIQVRAYGGPEVLRLEEVPAPAPGPGQLLVAVRAAGVNPADLKLRSGAFGELSPMTFPYIPGMDVGGTVLAVGPGAEFRVGDDVLGWRQPAGTPSTPSSRSQRGAHNHGRGRRRRQSPSPPRPRAAPSTPWAWTLATYS